MTEQQERKRVIRSFIRSAYSDERLAQLLAHAQDGKLAFDSCCCLIGIATWPGDHALALKYQRMGKINPIHNATALITLPGAREAEYAYANLLSDICDPDSDIDRRRILIPIIRTEIRRRDKLKAPIETPSTVCVSA